MDQLRIRHCRLRLRRRGGWSWGREPNRLVGLATQALPVLIAQKLKEMVDDRGGPQTIDRLSINVPVRLSELMALADRPNNDMPQPGVTDRIALQLRRALQAHVKADGPQGAAKPPSDPADSTATILPDHAVTNDGIDLLARWYQQGILPRLLRQFDDIALHAWQHLVLRSLSTQSAPVAGQQELMTEAASYSAGVSPSLQALNQTGARRLVLLAALLSRYPGQLSAEQIVGLLDRYTPDDPHDTGSIVQRPAGESAQERSATSTTGRQHSVTPRQQDTQERATGLHQSERVFTGRVELDVQSVLPFLAVGVLSRLGYLEVLSTALNAEHAESDIHCYAVALAYKMLPSPHRGWHRTDADSRTASAVVGLDSPVTGQEIDRFAFRAVNCLSPLDGFLRVMLAQGHDPLHPMVIHRLQCGDQPLWVLMDSQGCFPVGWFLSQDTLLQALDGFAGNTFLVTPASTHPSLFKALIKAKHRFLTSMPPARSDHWHPVDRQRTIWTNDPDPQPHWLFNQNRCLPACTEAADQVTSAMITNRPVLPPGLFTHPKITDPPRPDYAIRFELSVALTAASALATIAWELWGQNEPTSPTLTLERLGDLGGNVTLDQDKITVRPALGRRYMDLREHQMLVDVVQIPWLNGRRLEFVGL